MLGHSQNQQTSSGHVKQTTADNMYSFVKLCSGFNISQGAALKIMGSTMKVSAASMWNQGFKVVAPTKEMWNAYHRDQG